MGRKPAALPALVAAILLLFVVPLFAQVLPIPGFNQAYRDAHGYWGLYRMGTGGCPDRIETAGCLITSLAAVLNYYGITLSIPASESSTGKAREGMDPGILNDWLRAHNGYGRCTTDHVGNCCLEWTAVPKQVSFSEHENSATHGIDPASRFIINQALARGYPVIAGVHWGAHCHGTLNKTEDCHWVVITGRIGTGYAITDPYNRDVHDPHGVRTTLLHGVFGAYTIDRFVVVKAPLPTVRTFAIHLTFSGTPSGKTAVILSAATAGKYLVFVQVVAPDGTVYYARRPDPAQLDMQLSPKRVALVPEPIDLAPGKNVIGWFDTRAGPHGGYTILVQLEDPRRPGTSVATAIAAVSALKSKSVSVEPAIEWEIGIAIGAALLITLATVLIVLAAKP